MSDKPDDSSNNEVAEKLISLARAAEISGFSTGYLRSLVSRKIIWGTKIGRNWVTTEAAIRDYLATDRRPGPKPDEE